MYHEKTHDAAMARKQGQGKASTDEPTPIEVAYRSIRTIGDAVDKMTDALAMASTEARASGEHLIADADAMTPMASCILHLGATTEYAQKVDAGLAGAADLVRQAAIYDASHKNREETLVAEASGYRNGWSRSMAEFAKLREKYEDERARRKTAVYMNCFQSVVILGMVIMVLTA